MEKEFVTIDLALRLKALGFKERVLTYYEDGKPKLHTAIEGWDFNSSFLNCVSRPTNSQAFRWFRRPQNGSYNHLDFMYACLKDDSITYEEAELECLKKLIEIVESKTE